MPSVAQQIATNVAWSLLAYVIYIVMLALAIAFWRRHPTVSLLVVLAAIAFFMKEIFANVAFPLVIHTQQVATWPPNQIELAFSAVRLVIIVVDTLGMALLVSAVFAGRRRPAVGFN